MVWPTHGSRTAKEHEQSLQHNSSIDIGLRLHVYMYQLYAHMHKLQATETISAGNRRIALFVHQSVHGVSHLLQTMHLVFMVSHHTSLRICAGSD